MPLPTLSVLGAGRLWLELIYWLSLSLGQISICFPLRIPIYHLSKNDLVANEVRLSYLNTINDLER